MVLWDGSGSMETNDVLTGDATDRLVHLEHRGTAAEQSALVDRIERGLLHRHRRAHLAAGFDRLTHHRLELYEIDRLVDVIEGDVAATQKSSYFTRNPFITAPYLSLLAIIVPVGVGSKSRELLLY